MAYIRKTRGMLRLEKAYGVSDIRALLLNAYARHNTIKGVAREFKVSEQTMGTWFRQLGLHTRASLPAMSIPQDLSTDSVATSSGWSGNFDDETDEEDTEELDDDEGDENEDDDNADTNAANDIPF